MIFSEKFILLVPSTANRRQFDPSGERARMIDFRKQQLFFMDQKSVFFIWVSFSPVFLYKVLCERIENRTPKKRRRTARNDRVVAILAQTRDRAIF
jgi:cytochrome c oxidase assembly protein Cox11